MNSFGDGPGQYVRPAPLSKDGLLDWEGKALDPLWGTYGYGLCQWVSLVFKRRPYSTQYAYKSTHNGTERSILKSSFTTRIPVSTEWFQVVRASSIRAYELTLVTTDRGVLFFCTLAMDTSITYPVFRCNYSVIPNPIPPLGD